MPGSSNSLELLARASRTLFSSLQYDETLAALAKLIVPDVAEWCVVDVAERGALRRVYTAHSIPEMEELAKELDRRYPPRYDEPFGPGNVFRTATPELVTRIPDAMLRTGTQDDAHYEILKRLDLASYLALPMKSAGGTVVGVITLIRGSERSAFNLDDLELGEELAYRAAIAVHNAQATRELEVQTQRLRLAQQAANIGTWEIDLTSGAVSWSDELYDVVGFDHSIRPDFNYFMSQIVPDDQSTVTHSLQQQLASADDQMMFEYRILGNDGQTRWVSARGKISRDELGRPLKMIGIMIDITDRKLTEAALRESESMAAAGRLAATLAHEINNPLEAITNLVYLARNAKSLDEARGYIDIAEHELRRVSQVTAQTLRFYRDRQQCAENDLAELVDSALLVLSRKIVTKGIRVRNEVQRGTRVYCNAAEIRQVILNLIGNAVDALEKGGSIALRSSAREGSIAFTVADNGLGIPPAVASRLFRPFVTTKAGAGTGLGLWISKGLVEKNGGSIRFRSSTNSCPGTTFRVTLPRTAREASAAQPHRVTQAA